jgi:peptidoglycan/LPS O-acetylase OafA/YrhL
MAATLVAVAATVGLWLVLASVTRLIFHFLPGATFLAGAYAFRLAARERRASRLEIAAVLIASAVATGVGLIAVPVLGLELDEPPITMLVVGAGAVIGTVLLRRGAGPDDRRETEPSRHG